jgi:GT2 family glycosyltransferase
VSGPPLSVVIPSYNRADLLRRCLETVTAFAPPDTQVVVVDDASPDGIISHTALQYPAVQTLRLPRRSGFCVAANAGIRAATAPVVELLNDDTEVAPNWADAALPYFADPRIVAVAPLVLQLDRDRLAAGLPPLIDSAGDEYDPGGFARKRWHNAPLTPNPSPSRGEGSFVWGVSATAGFYRRSALLDAGLFPEHFGAYFEDVDLSHRLRKLGEVWLEPTSVVWHRVSSSYGKTPNRRVLEQQSCNEERVFWRNVRGVELLCNLPRHGAVLAGKAVRRVREGQLVPWAVGRLRAWCGR